MSGSRTCIGRAHGPLLVVLCLLATASPSRAQQVARFDRLLLELSRAPAGEHGGRIAAFVDEQRGAGGFPIRDASGETVFLYLADARTREVRLVGDFQTRSPTNPYWDASGIVLTKVGTLFYLRRMFESDARLDYRFLVDGEPKIDPLNPRRIMSGAGNGEASELLMPAHRVPPETNAQAGTPRGRLEVLNEPWANPKVTVYLPAGYQVTQRYPTIYTADGSAWVSYIGLPTALDNLIAARRIEPALAVMIDAASDRSAWYHCDGAYRSYLQRVVAYVDAHYATRPEPAARVHVGTSTGGKASLQVGVELPSLFGNLGLLSPSLAPRPTCLAPHLAGRTALPAARVWIMSGTYEGTIHRDAQTLDRLFTNAGAQVSASVVHQGHSFGAWRESVVGMLEYLLRR